MVERGASPPSELSEEGFYLSECPMEGPIYVYDSSPPHARLVLVLVLVGEAVYEVEFIVELS